MAYILPETLTVTRKFTLLGVVYNPGEEIDAKTFIHARGADSLLSRRYVIPTPDPHSRRTKPEQPTPTAMPAKVRKQIDKGPGIQPPDMILIIPDAPTILVGEQLQMTAAFQPPDSGGTVVWSQRPGDEAFFTIDQTGMVTGVGAGQGMVFADVEGATYRGQTYVTVNPPPPPAVTSVSATPNPMSVAGWSTLTIAVQPPEAGNPMDTVDVTTDNASIAVPAGGWVAVNQKDVNAVALGTCNITVASKADPNIKTVIPATVTLVREMEEETKKPPPRHRRSR